jgi:hypothetical protein
LPSVANGRDRRARVGAPVGCLHPQHEATNADREREEAFLSGGIVSHSHRTSGHVISRAASQEIAPREFNPELIAKENLPGHDARVRMRNARHVEGLSRAARTPIGPF